MRMKYLQEHMNGIYQHFLLSGTLKSHLLTIQEQAEERLDVLMKQMAKAQNVDEELKERENLFSDCDDTFAYIAGYTSGGAPYGTTWEEMGIDPYMDYDDKVKALLEGDF